LRILTTFGEEARISLYEFTILTATGGGERRETFVLPQHVSRRWGVLLDDLLLAQTLGLPSSVYQLEVIEVPLVLEQIGQLCLFLCLRLLGLLASAVAIDELNDRSFLGGVAEKLRKIALHQLLLRNLLDDLLKAAETGVLLRVDDAA